MVGQGTRSRKRHVPGKDMWAALGIYLLPHQPSGRTGGAPGDDVNRRVAENLESLACQAAWGDGLVCQAPPAHGGVSQGTPPSPRLRGMRAF